ncbi:MAG: zinc ribbon domain-containing protein [bacterium]
MSDAFTCPACGEEIPTGSRACPHCGACEKTGWNEEATRCNGLDLPDEDFDYDEFVKTEFGSSAKPRTISFLWWLVGIVTIIAFLLLLFL